jgi:hypothetical protein
VIDDTSTQSRRYYFGPTLAEFAAFTLLQWYHVRIDYTLQSLFCDESFTLEQP